MKKTISLMLVALLLVAVMAPTAFAAARGETVTVTVSATGEAFAGFTGTLNYDHSALKLESTAAASGTIMYNPGSDFFSWYVSENVSGTVAVMTATFTVLPDATCESADLSVTGVLAGNQDGVETTISVSTTGVSVDHIPGESYEEEHIAGDCVTDRCVDTVVKCAKCGKEISRTHNTTAAPGHKYEVTDHKDATCTVDGYTVYTCACGDTYTETIKATGHDHVLTNSTTGADCQTPGKDTYTCACGDTYTVDNDKYGDHKFTKCVWDGVDGVKHVHDWICELCGEVGIEDQACVDGDGDGYCDSCNHKMPVNKPTTGPTDGEGGNKTGDITPYPVFILMAVAAVMGTAYGFKRVR